MIFVYKNLGLTLIYEFNDDGKTLSVMESVGDKAFYSCSNLKLCNNKKEI